MQTIGERFEDMRKRKGVSLREAAEATKIRGDYLQKFESNHFDIGLSQIYVRGFLRSYASYLRLAPDRVLGDYDALGHDQERPRPSREAYGRMELTVSTPEERAERAAPPAPEAGAVEAVRTAPHIPRTRPSIMPNPGISPNLVFKAMIGVGGVIALLLIIWIAKAIFGGGSPAPAAVEHEHMPAAVATTVAPAPEPTVAIVAIDPVRVKVVRQSDGTELFQGQMERGDRRDFPNVPLLVTASAFESVRFEFKGKQYMIQAKGYNRYPIDANQFAR